MPTMTKKDARMIAEAKAALMAVIERALEGEGDVSEFEFSDDGDSVSVDMSHPDCCYIPLRVTVSFREP